MKWWYYALLVSLFMAAVLSLFASTDPDGLERVAEDLGFKEHETEPIISSPMPDYTVPDAPRYVSTALAGLAGTLIIFAAVFLIAKLLKSDENGA
jgi:cobalt/nickel transport protein